MMVFILKCNFFIILVFIVDAANICFVWIGQNTSPNEKHFALIYGNVFILSNLFTFLGIFKRK